MYLCDYINSQTKLICLNHSFESKYIYIYITWNYPIIYFIMFFVCLYILNNYNKFNLIYKTKNKNLQNK